MDTKDHRDKKNALGLYGTTQPLGRYATDGGHITLVQLGVVLLYQPTDTLSADFLCISHYTSPVITGYRYCLTSFIHQNVADFRRGVAKKEQADGYKRKWMEQKVCARDAKTKARRR